jgi:hypothetical protein
VHSENRGVLAFFLRKELFASDRARHDVADYWVPFGQVSREVHFLPFKALFEPVEPREAKIRANGFSSDKVNLPVYKE